MTLGISNQSLSGSEVPGYRALIKSWEDNTKPPCCIICQYSLLVDNDEDSENGSKNLQFTNVKCKI